MRLPPPLALLACADADLRARLEDALGEGWEAEGTQTCEQALALARTRLPRLVVCADADGPDLLAALRADLRTSHIPFVVLTDDGPETQAEFLRLGADVVLPRDITPVLFCAWVERIIALRRDLRERWSRRAALTVEWEAGDSEEVVFLDRAREATEAGLALPGFAVADLAHALHIGPRQLARRLKGLTGETPGALIRRLRMGRAAALLREGWNVNEVATAVGFQSRSQFRRAYQEAHGALPSVRGDQDAGPPP